MNLAKRKGRIHKDVLGDLGGFARAIEQAVSFVWRGFHFSFMNNTGS
jgi:hypothetical protein